MFSPFHKISISDPSNPEKYYIISEVQLSFLIRATEYVIHMGAPCDHSRYYRDYEEAILGLQEAHLCKTDLSTNNHSIIINPFILGIVAKEYCGIKDHEHLATVLEHQFIQATKGTDLRATIHSNPFIYFQQTFPNEFNLYVRELRHTVDEKEIRRNANLTKHITTTIAKYCFDEESNIQQLY